MCMDIVMKNENDVLALSKAAELAEGPISVHSLDGRIMLDARSVLSLFWLIGQKVRLVGGDHVDPKKFAKVAQVAGLA